jgi:hypothetical protein
MVYKKYGEREESEIYSRYSLQKLTAAPIPNPVFRATMALEAGAESHVGSVQHAYRSAEVLHMSRVGILRASAIGNMWRRNPP